MIVLRLLTVFLLIGPASSGFVTIVPFFSCVLNMLNVSLPTRYMFLNRVGQTSRPWILNVDFESLVVLVVSSCSMVHEFLTWSCTQFDSA